MPSSKASKGTISAPAIEESFFGYGSCRPKCLQFLLNNPKAFLFFLTFANIIQGICINGLLKVNVTSIERRFNLLSSESGLIISAYDIASCLTLLPVSYLGGHGHKPRWIGIGLIFTSIGMMVLASPHFLTGTYVYSTASSMDDNSTSSCVSAGAFSLDENDDLMCPEIPKQQNTVSLNNMKYVFFLGQFLIGVGSTPLAALTLTFLDESVDPSEYPVYIGIYYLGAIIGPAVGFLLGAKLLHVFTEVNVVPSDITPDSPQWVGAWWVGFVLCSFAMFLFAFPILGYPKVLRSTLNRQPTLADFGSLPENQPGTDKLHLLTKKANGGSENLRSPSSGKPEKADSAYLSSTKNNVSLEYDETVSAISNQRQLTAKDEANKPMLDPVVLAVQSQKELPSAIAKSSRYYEASPVFGEHESKVDEIEAENLVIVPEEEDHEHASESDPNLTELQQTGPASNGLLGLCPSVLVPRSGSLDAMMPDKTTPSNMTKLRIVQNFFREMLEIVTDKAFVSLTLAAAVLGTIVSGFSTFGPKFIESQFRKSPADAANVFGFIFIPGSAIGLLLGSFLMSGLKIRHKKALLTCFAVSVCGLFVQLIIILNCEDIDFAGVTVPYNGQSELQSPQNFNDECNADCNCSALALDPVCADDGITYFSACFAGCRSKTNGSETLFDVSRCYPYYCC